MEKYTCVLLLGGSGERMGLGYNKVLYKINGKKEIYKFSLDVFMADEKCGEIVLVVNEKDMPHFKGLDDERKEIKVKAGGKTRGESVLNGLKASTMNYVMIHDSARPLLTLDELKSLYECMIQNGNACLSGRIFDTISEYGNGKIKGYLDRNTLTSIKTPQCFKTEEILDAYNKSIDDKLSFSDDTSVYREYYGDVNLVFTNSMSLKATTIEDLRILEAILDENRKLD